MEVYHLLMAINKKANVRTPVTISPEMSKGIEDFRFQRRIDTESEAIRQIIDAGILSIKEKK